MDLEVLKIKALAWFHRNLLYIMLAVMWSLVGLIALCVSASKDSPIEELSEREIEMLTGFKIDFSTKGPQGVDLMPTPSGANTNFLLIC